MVGHKTGIRLTNAWMYLTDGRPSEINLVKDEPDVQWEGVPPWPRVAEFRQQNLGYNKEHNLFLVSDRFLDGRTEQSSKNRQARAQFADDSDVTDCQNGDPKEV